VHHVGILYDHYVVVAKFRERLAVKNKQHRSLM